MSNTSVRRLALSLPIVLALAVGLTRTMTPVAAASGGIVISQVYGGGGNSGATLKNDYIELFNRGAVDVDVTGWSVQYGSATGSAWTNITNLSGTIQAGHYYLIQEAAGAGGTANLPTPDVTGSINMSATGAKVALVSATTALSGSCPTGTSIIDFVGYGTGSSQPNCFEAAPAPTLSNTTAAFRAGNGCTDADNNGADFSTGAPNPRNSSSPVNSCGLPTNPGGAGAANPSSVLAGASTVLTIAVTPGANPASTELAVVADLSAIGGSATQQFFDDGTNGDVSIGDNVFSFQATIAPGTSVGPKSLPATITDAQSRTGAASIALTVTTLSTSPTGVGAASPSGLQAGNQTLLTVSVTPGTNPTSTGIAVAGDLSSIGGSASQPFFDNGSNGDLVSGDGTFSYRATVVAGTPAGLKSLPVTVADAQSRSTSTALALTVQPPASPTTVKISQVFGGGGNSGSTYQNDFIEIFNRSTTAVDLAGWSVQYRSAGDSGSVWPVTSLCPSGPCLLPPGRYLLVQESPGAGGTTPLPTPDVVGGIPMSATSGRVALVNTTDPLSSSCPLGSVADLVGYGSAVCSETATTPALTNLTAGIRLGNGCTDTDNNFNDFVTSGGPIPRNSASPANSCGGDPTLPSGSGTAQPTSLEPATNVLLTVAVTPATAPPSTGLSVTADLASIGGASSQPFFDDGTNGDLTAGDNVFSFQATTGAFIGTGAKSMVATIGDAQGRSAAAPITLTIQSPTCGVERWAVKTGTDSDAGLVNLGVVIPTTISALIAYPAPVDPPGPPLDARVGPAELNVWSLNATMTLFKKETDVDYHIVLQDDSGRTLVSEIPSPGCVGATSPFGPFVAAARRKFDSRFAATPAFQPVSVPVQVKGVGFFDFIHGQTGVAPNGIELHPVLEINFTANTTTTLTSGGNPSVFGEPIVVTVAVSGSGSVPSGSVTLSDGAAELDSKVLDASGEALFTLPTLAAGHHSLTASYGGDGSSAPSVSATVDQIVNKADQSIGFGPLAGKTYGDADFAVTAIATSGLPVTFSVASGPATVFGNSVHITGAGAVTLRASQSGDDSYNAAPDVAQTFTVGPGTARLTITGYSGVYDGVAHGASGSAVGINGEDLSSLLNLGATFANVPGGAAHWTFIGNADYAAASGDASIAITPATATIRVNGYSGPFDAQAHGASGTASGVAGEDLTGFVTLGATFTNVPGGTATWSFAGNADYAPAGGSAAIVIAAVTPSFSQLSSPVIGDSAASATLGGAIRLGSLVPTGSVSTTIHGVTEVAVIQPDGAFSSTFATTGLSPLGSPFPVVFVYPGDGNFNAASGTASLTVTDTTPPTIAPHATVTAEATSAAGARVAYTPPATSDAVDGPGVATCAPAPGSLFPIGTSHVTCNASDAHHNAAAPTTFAVIVRDTTAPSAPILTVTPAVLWPPDNQLVPVRLTARATDAVDPAPVCRLTGIASTDHDSRDRGVDFRITGPLTALLRAEEADDDGRKGGGRDRDKDDDREALVYTLTVSCSDAAGNTGKAATINVIVPHDRR